MCGALRDGSKSVATADMADLERVMAVNVAGPLLCCREAMRYMSNKGGENTAGDGGGGGAIVNVSSGSAVIGRPLLYAMSKAGPQTRLFGSD